jgi:uncharacterized membrane protein YagU involved in acid resistance
MVRAFLVLAAWAVIAAGIIYILVRVGSEAQP